MEVNPAINSVSPPPKPREPQVNRAQEFRAEQQRLQQDAQRQEAGNKPEPVVNTQGQTTGRLVNEKA